MIASPHCQASFLFALGSRFPLRSQQSTQSTGLFSKSRSRSLSQLSRQITPSGENLVMAIFICKKGDSTLKPTNSCQICKNLQQVAYTGQDKHILVHCASLALGQRLLMFCDNVFYRKICPYQVRAVSVVDSLEFPRSPGNSHTIRCSFILFSST